MLKSVVCYQSIVSSLLGGNKNTQYHDGSKKLQLLVGNQQKRGQPIGVKSVRTLRYPQDISKLVQISTHRVNPPTILVLLWRYP